MSHDHRNRMERSPGADPAVTTLLRAAYAPPADEAYWKTLEARVMSRLQEATPEAWWTVLSEWRSAGLVAATLALLIAGGTVVREQQRAETERQLAAVAAYYTVFDDSDDLSMTITIPPDSSPVVAPERYLEPFYP